MNSYGFDKVIKKIVLLKNPWIVDYEILTDFEGDLGFNRRTYYRVNYFTTTEWRKKNGNDVLLNDMKKVEDTTKALFKALGFDENHKLDGVDFYVVAPRNKI